MPGEVCGLVLKAQQCDEHNHQIHHLIQLRHKMTLPQDKDRYESEQGRRQQHLVTWTPEHRVSKICNDDIKCAFTLLELSLGIVIDQVQFGISKSLLVSFQVLVAEVTDILHQQAAAPQAEEKDKLQCRCLA